MESSSFVIMDDRLLNGFCQFPVSLLLGSYLTFDAQVGLWDKLHCLFTVYSFLIIFVINQINDNFD